VSKLVLDASALTALFRQERGADAIAEAAPTAIISSVNLSEVIARELEAGMPMETIEFHLNRLSIPVVPFDAALAKIAASLKSATRPYGLSLADRACLALAMDRNLPAMTGDRDWAKPGLDVELVFFR
jgi:ribonuclease VapC